MRSSNDVARDCRPDYSESLNNDKLQCGIALSRELLKNEEQQVLNNDKLQCGIALPRELLKNEELQVLNNDTLQCAVALSRELLRNERQQCRRGKAAEYRLKARWPVRLVAALVIWDRGGSRPDGLSLLAESWPPAGPCVVMCLGVEIPVGDLPP